MASHATAWFTLVALVCSVALVSCNSNKASDSSPDHSKLVASTASYGKMPDGRKVNLYILTNVNGMRVQLTNYGAITVGVEVRNRAGEPADVTLGYDSLDGWLGSTSYFGATVGRYANRIAKGKFTLDGTTYTLATNDKTNHLHGGVRGFDKVLWDAKTVRTADAVGVEFTYVSKDGEEGYPGNLKVTALYTLNNANEFKAEFFATTDKPTIVNLAHHTYWNLSGGLRSILGEKLMLAADKYTPVDAGLIPTGELRDVAGTPMDFNTPTEIGARIAQVEGGYDHNWVLRNQSGEVKLAASLYDPLSGRLMEIFSDQPGIQFYSGNFLDGTVKGKGGITYLKNWGLCLETQHYPDSPNHPEFPSVVLRPGQTYHHVMIHKFSTR